jgi:UDP-glucose 4-epimerase
MNVLVTGGAGYIGSVVVEMLMKEKFSVVVVDSLVEGHRNAVSDSIPFIKDDIVNRENMKKVFIDYKIDAVVHMAGETLVSKSMTHPENYFTNNVTKGLELLEAMRQTGVKRIIFSSTAALFGNPEYTPITEYHPTNPINAYGRSKLMFEQMMEWYNSAHGLNYVSLRYFNAAGATEEHGEHHTIETHLIPIVMQAALGQREHVDVYGTDYDTKDGTNGEGYSVTEVIAAAREITGHPIPARQATRRPGDPAILVASSKLTRSLLGLIPKYPDIRQIVESAWKWHSKHPNGYK